jgi:hypothetical protein
MHVVSMRNVKVLLYVRSVAVSPMLMYDAPSIFCYTVRQLLALLSFLMPRVFKTETIDVLLQVLQRGMKAPDGTYCTLSL